MANSHTYGELWQTCLNRIRQQISEEEFDKPLKSVIRKATEEDIETNKIKNPALTNRISIFKEFPKDNLPLP